MDLAGAVLPLSTRGLQSELEDRLARLPNEINEYGYDSLRALAGLPRRSLLPGALLYKYWFRCQTRHIERLPPGRMLLIANHAGQLPFDGAMLSSALADGGRAAANRPRHGRVLRVPVAVGGGRRRRGAAPWWGRPPTACTCSRTKSV